MINSAHPDTKTGVRTQTPLIYDEKIYDIRATVNQQLVQGRDIFKVKIEEMPKRQTRPKLLARHRIKEEESGYYFI